MPIHNVGLLVDFRLGNKSHLAFVRGLGSLAPVRSTWDIPTPAPTAGIRGNLLGLWVIGRVVCALEFYISILNSLTPKSVPAGTKLVLFGRYILNIYVGIVDMFYAKRKLSAPKSTYRHNAQIGEYRTILTSAKKIRF